MWIGLLVVTCLHGAGTTRAADFLRVEGSVVKWPPPAIGVTTVITFALLTKPFVITRGLRTLSPDNCGVMQGISEVVTQSADVTDVQLKQELRAAITTWEDVADIKFVEVREPEFAHLVVGAAEASTGPAFANLRLGGPLGVQRSSDKALAGESGGVATASPAAFDDNAVLLIEQAFVCLNPKMRWKIGFDGNLGTFDLRHAFTHEFGHAIGLDHPGRSGSVMGFRYDESVRGLKSADIAAVQLLYGPAKRSTASTP